MISFQTVVEKRTWGPVRFGIRPFLHKRYCQKKDLSRQSGVGSMMMMRERGCSPDAYVVTVQYGSRNRIEGTHERFHCSTNSPFNKALEYYLHPSHNNLRKLSGRWHSRLSDAEPTRLTAQNLTQTNPQQRNTNPSYLHRLSCRTPYFTLSFYPICFLNFYQIFVFFIICFI